MARKISTLLGILVMVLAHAAHAAVYLSPVLDPRSPQVDPNPLPNPVVVTRPSVLRVHAVGDTWMQVAVTTGSASSTLLRSTSPTSGFRAVRTLAKNQNQLLMDTGLKQHTRYCYRVDAVGFGTVRGPTCKTTYWTKQAFENDITRADSMRVLGAFDWRRTDPLPELDTLGRPALYYMNVLVTYEQGAANGGVFAVRDLKNLGIHVEELPLFPIEAAGWDSQQAIAWKKTVVDGMPVEQIAGRWYYAVVPAFSYNRVREASLELIASGQPPEVAALVYRRVPIEAAKAPNPYQLGYRYLADQGFEYNAEALCTDVNGDGVKECPQFIGHLFRKTIAKLFESGDWVYEQVRRAINEIDKAARGSVDVDVHFRALNSDPAFGVGTPMVSGWRGGPAPVPLELANLHIELRQGAGLVLSQTDAQGRAHLEASEGLDSTFCVELENEWLRIVDSWLFTKTVCFDELNSFNEDVSIEVDAEHRLLNQLLQMTDAAEYARDVWSFDLNRGRVDFPKVTVQVGWIADAITVDSRSFAPCMGRDWNPEIGGIGNALLSLVGQVLPTGILTGPIVEALFTTDIFLDSEDVNSRGVGVHEFGHVITCGLIADEADQQFQTAWTHVIGATLTGQHSESMHVAEAIADYFSSQVVGGTNYFVVAGSVSDNVSMAYCPPGNDCLDFDYTQADSTGDEFTTRIRRFASILHDAFDPDSSGTPVISNATAPNDGSHWTGNVGGPFTWAGDTYEESDGTAGSPDDPIALPGSSIRSLFRRWIDDGSVILQEETLLETLGDLLRERGYTQPEICGLYTRHTVGAACPSYLELGTNPAPALPLTPPPALTKVKAR